MSNEQPKKDPNTGWDDALAGWIDLFKPKPNGTKR